MLPKSRSAPQWQEPIPPEPPAMKPPMVAVAKVEGVMRSSCPECSRVSRSRSRMTQPGSAMTRPGWISFTLFMWRRCMTQPPASGMACP